mmetsp:Transcript_100210/g.259112  ORF Transcript_100210/g.259112 Transcript_100210/m.259112 type:complete len:270 (-) Transcript_100210:11-820(-)
MGEDVRSDEVEELELPRLCQQFRVVQSLGMPEEGGCVVHDEKFLFLGAAFQAFLPERLAMLEHQVTMFDQQWDVHQLQRLDVHERAPKELAKGLLELPALLLQLDLAVVIGPHRIHDGSFLLSWVVLPLLEVVHHAKAKVHLRLLDKNADGVLMCLLVPESALGVLVATMCLRDLRIRGHPSLELHEPRELLEGIHELDPLGGEDRVLVNIPHALAARLRAHLQRPVGLAAGVVLRVLRCGGHPAIATSSARMEGGICARSALLRLSVD